MHGSGAQPEFKGKSTSMIFDSAFWEVAFPAYLGCRAAMAIDEPSDVTPIKQAQSRRAKAHRKSLICGHFPIL
jgi:hypothetical protein